MRRHRKQISAGLILSFRRMINALPMRLTGSLCVIRSGGRSRQNGGDYYRQAVACEGRRAGPPGD
jgi:hypothetical protein